MSTGPGGVLLTLTRVWVPVIIAVAGLAGILIGHGSTNSVWAAAGVSLIIVALIVWMINWMFRMSVQSNRDREREEAAREYFDKHGRWPE
jgi:xanthosine utilization system XapX-like protein